MAGEEELSADLVGSDQSVEGGENRLGRLRRTEHALSVDEIGRLVEVLFTVGGLIDARVRIAGGVKVQEEARLATCTLSVSQVEACFTSVANRWVGGVDCLTVYCFARYRAKFTLEAGVRAVTIKSGLK